MAFAGIVHHLFEAAFVVAVPIAVAHHVEAAVPEKSTGIACGGGFVDEVFAFLDGVFAGEVGGMLIPEFKAARGKDGLRGECDKKEGDAEDADRCQFGVHYKENIEYCI